MTVAASADPLISVILPTFNNADTIIEAALSVLADGAAHLELLVIDDGSTDDTSGRLQKINDKRLRVIGMGQNQGLPKALNVGLDAARGRFIARMDADDISLPGRLDAQVAAFNAEPSLVMCGTSAEIIGDVSASDAALHAIPGDPEEVRQELWFRTPILHPTVMFDRSRIPEFALHYLETLQVRQDQELFLRLLEFGEARNLEQCFVQYRRHPQAATIAKVNRQRKGRAVVVANALTMRGIIFDQSELAAHVALCPLLPGEIPTGDVHLEEARAWTERLFDMRVRLGIRDEDLWRERLENLVQVAFNNKSLSA